MSDFEVICLANSRKWQGRCVAGIRTDGQGWIRPVGWSANGSLAVNNYWLDNNTEVQPLDVIRLRCIRPCPKPHHPEDWTNAGSQWQLIARPASAEHLELLKTHLVDGSALFGNTQDKTPAAQFNMVPAAASLAIIAPDNLQWAIQDSDGKRKIRVQFTLCNAPYRLTLTDPIYEQKLGHLRPGVYLPAAAGIPNGAKIWLTISLSEPFQKTVGVEAFCYKLVAGVMVVPQDSPGVSAGTALETEIMPGAAHNEPEPPDWSWLPPAVLPMRPPVSNTTPPTRPPTPVPAPPVTPTAPTPVSSAIPLAPIAAPKSKPPSQRMAELRAVHTRNYERWTEEEEASLLHMIRAGHSCEEIMNALQRAESAVLTRIGKLVLDRHRDLL